ncbi:MAG: hypothetical protein ACI4S2_00800 [Lachnospiraceae bacterium]
MKSRRKIISALCLVGILISILTGCGGNSKSTRTGEIEFTAIAEGTLEVSEAGIEKIPYTYAYKGKIDICPNGDYYMKGNRKLTLDTDVSTVETEGYGSEENYYYKEHNKWKKQENPAFETAVTKGSGITSDEFLAFFGELGTYLGDGLRMSVKEEEEENKNAGKLTIPNCVGQTWEMDGGDFELQDISLSYVVNSDKASEISVPEDVVSLAKKTEKELEYDKFNPAEQEYVYTQEGTYLIRRNADGATLVEVKVPDEGLKNRNSSEYYVSCEMDDPYATFSVECSSAVVETVEEYLAECGTEIEKCESKDGREYSYSILKSEDEVQSSRLRIAANLKKGQVLEIEIVSDAEEFLTEDMVQKTIDNITIYDEE